jgi:catechol 2,3-dioxygenase-like lactoylglutathione lyase family enzyme
MTIAFTATKLVVRDVPRIEAFYRGIGLQLVSRNLGGEEEVRQEQAWLSASGDMTSHVLILTRFTELPLPDEPAYPGETWQCFRVDDVDGTSARVTALGGRVVRAGQNRPEHGVRAAVVADPEGHLIELVGPILD